MEKQKANNMSQTLKEMKFKTQQEIWKHLVTGGSVFQDTVEIKFKDGAVHACLHDKWNYCPISFENPRLFTC